MTSQLQIVFVYILHTTLSIILSMYDTLLLSSLNFAVEFFVDSHAFDTLHTTLVLSYA